MTEVAIDVALLIFEEMREFAKAAKPKANLPFDSLVTRLCDHAKVKSYAHDTLLPPKTCAIEKSSSSKRDAKAGRERPRAPRLCQQGHPLQHLPHMP